MSQVGRTVTVAVGRFEPLVGSGLERVLGESPRVRVLVTELDDAELRRFVVNEGPRVAIVGPAAPYGLLLCLKDSQPAIGVVVLAPDPGQLWGELLVEAGATCVDPSASKLDILGAIRLAARGKPTYVPAPGQEARVVSGQAELTNRETQVFELLSKGRTNLEIASALHISIETVTTHVAKIFRKLGVHKRQQLSGMRVPHRRK